MASKNTSSTTGQVSNQKTSVEGGSSSTTNTHSEGGSHSVTQGYSDTVSRSEGGASSLSTGKSYASGQVAENTQANFNRYGNEYVQSGNVANAYNNLQAAISGKPTFQSTYEDRLASMYDQIMGRDKFSYNFNNDPMYQLYRGQYGMQGRQAMQDTMGQAAALNGGYGSSYSQTAGQQTYQNYLQQLNNMIPELRNQAFQEYQAEGQELLNRYNVTADAYNREYGQYRDATSDWQSDRAFNQSAYTDERNFDYNKYSDNRNYWTQEYWNERNAEQSNIQTSDSTNWQDSKSHTNSFSQTDTTNWQDTTSTTNSTNWQNTNVDTTQFGFTDTGKASGSGSGSGSSGVKMSKTNPSSELPWSHDVTDKGVSSGDIVQALYGLYADELKSGGDPNRAVSVALADLDKNGLVTDDTRYTFDSDNIADIERDLRSMMDNMYRYSKGNSGLSMATTGTAYNQSNLAKKKEYGKLW